MNVLIFGGTGTMGRYLVETLSENADCHIYITSRTEHVSQNENIQYILGNAHDLDFVRTLMEMETWDAIVDFMIYSTKEFAERIDTLLSGCRQYLFISSARVYAESTDALTESSDRLLDVSKDEKFLATDKYALSKAREEDLLKKSQLNNYTIIRPYITYSNVRFQLGVFEKEDWLYRVLHNRAIVFSRDIAGKQTTLTYGKDVAKRIARLIGNKDSYGEAFHITTQESLTWETVLNMYVNILTELGYAPKIVWSEYAEEICNQDEKTKYDRLYDRVFDNSKVNQFCNNEPFLQTSIGLDVCMRDFLQNINFGRINWVTQARMDRISGDRTPIKEIRGKKNKFKYFCLRYLIKYEWAKKMYSFRFRKKY